MKKRENMLKMAMACFLGGVIGTVVGLLVTPLLAWLGTLAGAAAGYIAYDFREVLRAIPEALKKSNAGLCENIETLVRWEWGRKKHPFIYSAFISGYAITLHYSQPLIDSLYSDPDKRAPLAFIMLAAAAKFFVTLAVTFCASIIYFAFLTAIGMGLLKMQADSDDYWVCKVKGSDKIRPMTYGDFLVCFLTGSLFGPFFVVGWFLAHVIKFCFYSFWVGLGNFLKWLFVMIHCADRVCAAVYGGTSATAMIVYGLLFMPNRTPWDVAFLSVCGGLLAAFTGATIGRRLVSFAQPILLAEYQKVKS